jgi:hypothetical protein
LDGDVLESRRKRFGAAVGAKTRRVRDESETRCAKREHDPRFSARLRPLGGCERRRADFVQHEVWAARPERFNRFGRKPMSKLMLVFLVAMTLLGGCKSKTEKGQGERLSARSLSEISNLEGRINNLRTVRSS